MSIHNPIDDKKSRDLNKALQGVGGRRNLEEMRKVIDGMNRSREETRQQIGIVDVAVELIRDARNP